MSTETAAQLDYVDYMAKPFVDSLVEYELSDEERLSRSSFEPWVFPYLSQAAVRAALEGAKLDETDLPWKPGTNGDLSPQQFAERLTAFAYDDGLTLLHIADTILRTEGIGNGQEIGQVMYDSTVQLVSVAGLDESSKSKLTNHLKRTILKDPYAKFYEYMPKPLKDLEEGEALIYDPSIKQLLWHPKIKDWINTITLNLPESGCPAHKKVIEAFNKKQILTHFFWRKLVSIAYDTPNQ